MRSRAVQAAVLSAAVLMLAVGVVRVAGSAPAGVTVAAAAPVVSVVSVPIRRVIEPEGTTTTTTLPPRRFAPEVSRSSNSHLVTTTVAPRWQSGAYPAGYSTGCWPSVGMAPRNPTETCISAREHGGCYDRSANPSHFGRWQFDRATWAGNGGSPGDWGYASPAEQDRVFLYAVDHGGYGRWTNYDGC